MKQKRTLSVKQRSRVRLSVRLFVCLVFFLTYIFLRRVVLALNEAFISHLFRSVLDVWPTGGPIAVVSEIANPAAANYTRNVIFFSLLDNFVILCPGSFIVSMELLL